MTVQPDDDVEREDPEIRRAKLVLFLLTFLAVLALIVVLLTFFQPENQLVITRYPNGYPRTKTHFVMDDAGSHVEHGSHKAYHASGRLSEEGTFQHGVRVGEWWFWDEAGELDDERSGQYAGGTRVDSSGQPR